MFTELPRFFGRPKTCYVESEVALKNLIRICNGKTPCFVSSYVFPTKSSILVDNIPSDYDNDVSLSPPYNDVARLKDFCIDHSFPYVIDFSGSKGFHHFFNVEPVYCADDSEKTAMRDKIYSIQLSLEEAFQLTSLDHKFTGRINPLIRLPTSKYVDKNGKKNGLYCRYLEPEDFEKGIEHIVKLAKKPGKVPKTPETDVTIDDIIHAIPKFTLRKQRRTFDGENTNFKREGIVVPTLEGIAAICLIRGLQFKKGTAINPPHEIRLEATAWLKYMGYRDVAVVEFFKRLGWSSWDFTKTMEQVRSVLPRLPKCTMLRAEFGDELCKDCILGRR